MKDKRASSWRNNPPDGHVAMTGLKTERKQIGVAQIRETWELQRTVEKTLEYLISFPPVQFRKRKPGVHRVYELGERVKNKVTS